MKRRSKRRTKRPYRKRVKKTRGGFFTGTSYLLQQGLSIFQVPPPVAHGNPAFPVNPFPHVQGK